MSKYNFRPVSIDEEIVFGASRPGYGIDNANEYIIDSWCCFLDQHGIKRLLVLLDFNQLMNYSIDYLGYLKKRYGDENVLAVPVQDYHLIDKRRFKEIVKPFLKYSRHNRIKTVIHCAGGIGRTGHIAAGYLSCVVGFSVEEAISSVIEMGFNPYEAVEKGNANEDELIDLLTFCRELH